MAGDSTGGKTVQNFSANANPMGVLSGTTMVQGVNAQMPNRQYIQPAQQAWMGKNANGADVLQNTAYADTSVYLLNQQQQKTLVDTMDATFGRGKWKPSTLQTFYGKGVGLSAYLWSNAQQRVDPVNATMLAIQQEARLRQQAGLAGGGKGSGGVSSSTQTTTSVNLTDPVSARKMVNDALGQYLGRAATQQEQQAFMKALSQQERMNPTVTTQSSTTRSGGGSSSTRSSVTSQGGFNPSAFAEEYARGMEGSGEYQAATGLLNTFISALGEAV